METNGEIVETGELQEAMPLSLESLSNRKLGDEKPNLDGQEALIGDVVLLPKKAEQKSKDGKHTYRDVLVRLVYRVGESEVFEHLGGMKQFKHGEEWGEPTFIATGNSQIAELFRMWLAKKGKKAEEASLKGFLKGLIGMKCVLTCRNVNYQGKEFRKNLVREFGT